MPGGQQMEAQPSEPNRHSIAARPSSTGGKDRASKIWMTADADANAAVATGDFETKLAVVKCTTRFATCMCVIIAVCKVIAYLQCGKDVVKTSALDSLGDLVANCMTLYTGYRMSQIDTKRYPVGQNKFAHVGCLIFSTFMFALMFNGALGNLESLVETNDDIGYAALSRFFWTTPSLKEFAEYNAEVAYRDDAFVWEDIGEDRSQWSKRLADLKNNSISAETPLEPNPLIKFYEEGTDAQKEEAKEMQKENDGEVTKGDIVKACAEYDDPVKKRSDLILQNVFLGCCATYKLCLWLYCVLYAIPQSGSQVLVALATDKRNDFICTYSAIVATTIAYACGDSFPIPEDRVDPLVSLVMCFFIMYSWQQLVVEHATILSLESADKDFRFEVIDDVKKGIKGTVCGVADDGVKVYVTSEKCTAEIELVVKDKDASWKEIEKVIKRVKYSVESKENVEKCLITTIVAPPVKDPY